MTLDGAHDGEGGHHEVDLTESETARHQLEHDLEHWGHLIPNGSR